MLISSTKREMTKAWFLKVCEITHNIDKLRVKEFKLNLLSKTVSLRSKSIQGSRERPFKTYGKILTTQETHQTLLQVIKSIINLFIRSQEDTKPTERETCHKWALHNKPKTKIGITVTKLKNKDLRLWVCLGKLRWRSRCMLIILGISWRTTQRSKKFIRNNKNWWDFHKQLYKHLCRTMTEIAITLTNSPQV